MPSIVLDRTDDPRSNLQKAKRVELAKFAADNGVTEIDPRMPANVMRKILHRKGLHNIPIPKRTLGQIGNPGYNKNGVSALDVEAITDSGTGTEVDAEDLELAQWNAQLAQLEQSQPEPAPAPAPAPGPDAPITLKTMPTQMAELHKYAKKLGLKTKWGMKKIDLVRLIRDHLDGQNAT